MLWSVFRHVYIFSSIDFAIFVHAERMEKYFYSLFIRNIQLQSWRDTFGYLLMDTVAR